MNEKDHIYNLLAAHLQDRLSPKQMEELLQSVETGALEQAWKDAIADMSEAGQQAATFDEVKWEPVMQQILESADKSQNPGSKVVRLSDGNRFASRWWMMAAVIAVAVAVLLVFYILPGHKNDAGTAVVAKGAGILPGRVGAVLTLHDGRKVVFDAGTKGVVASEDGVSLTFEGQQLCYTLRNGKVVAEGFNTITTPPGRQFRIKLSDGTAIWLNAASTLRYPVYFNGTQRQLELVSGEAYFEVVGKAHSPFLLTANQRANINVLGTSFNVQAYAHDTIVSTTLLEGRLRVSLPGNSSANGIQELKAGQQSAVYSNNNTAIPSPASRIKLIDNINLEGVVAWKNGKFDFTGLALQQVMRQLQDWYNIEVVYENGIPEQHFGFLGEIDRNVALTDLMDVLAGMGLKFRLENEHRLVIMK